MEISIGRRDEILRHGSLWKGKGSKIVSISVFFVQVGMYGGGGSVQNLHSLKNVRILDNRGLFVITIFLRNLGSFLKN